MFTRYLIPILALMAAPSLAKTVELPAEVIGGGPVRVMIAGLRPGAAATVTADRVMLSDGVPEAYRSTAHFVADRHGRIDPATAAATGGDYTGVDAAGLFWSMHPEPAVPADVAPDTARICVVAMGGAPICAVTHFRVGDRRVVSEPVGGFPGAMLYRLPGHDRRPVVIALVGSEGGSSFGRELGPWLAGQGYAVIALPYYAPDWSAEKLPGLPVDFADIPVDRLEQVRAWIADRSDLDGRRIGLYGVSKGGEFAIIAASRFDWLSAVAAVVPSDVVWEGWGPNVTKDDTRSSFSWRGEPLPYVPYAGMRETIVALYRGEPRTLRTPHEQGRAANPARVAAATIPIEKFKGALLVAGGELDQTWPSADMVRSIAAWRARAGLRTEALTFPGAGHGLSGSGWEPSNYPRTNGNAGPTAHGQAAVRAAVLALFKSALR